MSITTSRVSGGVETLAHRFASYLATTDTPSDVGVLVRSFELPTRFHMAPLVPQATTGRCKLHG
jgi:hypothetical protein